MPKYLSKAHQWVRAGPLQDLCEVPTKLCGESKLLHLPPILRQQCPDARAIEKLFKAMWIQAAPVAQQVHGRPIGTTWYELLIAYHVLGYKLTLATDQQAAAAVQPSLGKLLQIRRVGHAILPTR